MEPGAAAQGWWARGASRRDGGRAQGGGGGFRRRRRAAGPRGLRPFAPGAKAPLAVLLALLTLLLGEELLGEAANLQKDWTVRIWYNSCGSQCSSSQPGYNAGLHSFYTEPDTCTNEMISEGTCPSNYWRPKSFYGAHPNGLSSAGSHSYAHMRSPKYFIPAGSYSIILYTHHVVAIHAWLNWATEIEQSETSSTGRIYLGGGMTVPSGTDEWPGRHYSFTLSAGRYAFFSVYVGKRSEPDYGLKFVPKNGNGAGTITELGIIEGNSTTTSDVSQRTCYFDDFHDLGDCPSFQVQVSNAGQGQLSSLFRSDSGLDAYNFTPAASFVVPAEDQQTATVQVTPERMERGIYSDQLSLMTNEVLFCVGEDKYYFQESSSSQRCRSDLVDLNIYVNSTGNVNALPQNPKWNCTLDTTSTFCPDVVVPLENTGNASIAWKIVLDEEKLQVTLGGEGVVGSRQTVSPVIDFQEARFPPGSNEEVVKLYTNEIGAFCKGVNDTSLEGYTCLHSQVHLHVEVDNISGLVVYPQLHTLDVPLDERVTSSISGIYVEVDNSVPYRVDMDPLCGAGMAVEAEEETGSLVRLIPQTIGFTAIGLESVPTFSFNGTEVRCKHNITRTDDELRKVAVNFDLTLRPGVPSTLTTMAVMGADANGTVAAGQALTVTFATRDRLGNPCDQIWPNVQLKLKGTSSKDGSITELGVAAPQPGSANYDVQLAQLSLPPGTYTLRGYLSTGSDSDSEDGDGVAGANTTEGVPLTTTALLEVSPVQCTRQGESAARTGVTCECDAGYGGSSEGSGCGVCPAGSYKNQPGNFECVSCPGGATTREAGSKDVEECLCPIGSFLSGDETSAGCTPCVAELGQGASTAEMGATSVDDCRCEPIYYRDEVGKCVECPEGARCNGGYASSLELKSGFWRSSANSQQLHTCDAPRGIDICTGGVIDSMASFDQGHQGDDYASNALCRSGHSGALCWECADGFGKRLGVCEKCSSSGGAMGQSVAFVLLGVLLFLVAMVVLITQSLSRAMSDTPTTTGSVGGPGEFEPSPKVALDDKKENVAVGVIKVMITWLQLASLANSVRVPTSPEMKETLKWIDLGNVSPWSFSSFNCAVDVDYYAKFYMTTFVPLACIPLGAGLTAILSIVARRKGWTPRFIKRDVFIMSMELLFFLSYTMVNNVTMSVFKCRELDEGLAVLAADPSVVCGTKQHKSAVVVGWLSVVLITVGLPLQAFVQMYLNRGRLDTLTMRVRLGFFFQNYRTEVYWYECFSLLRKAAIVATVVLLQDQVGLQVFCVTLVSIVFLTMHTYHKPYDSLLLNTLESAALFVATITLTSCTFFYVVKQTGKGYRGFELVLSWSIILMSAGLLGVCFVIIVKDIKGTVLDARKARNQAEIQLGQIRQSKANSLFEEGLGKGAMATGAAVAAGVQRLSCEFNQADGLWAEDGQSVEVTRNPLYN